MTRPKSSAFAAIVLAAGLCSAGAPARAQCLLCTPAPAGPRARPESDARPAAPLRIELGDALDFTRVAVTANGGGDVEVDPVSRARIVSGALSDLGGISVAGTIIIHGEPGRAVRVELPRTAVLRAPGGAEAPVTRIMTDLPPAPRLGGDGTLRFRFGGRLQVRGGADGDYRGEIAVIADYE